MGFHSLPPSVSLELKPGSIEKRARDKQKRVARDRSLEGGRGGRGALLQERTEENPRCGKRCIPVPECTVRLALPGCHSGADGALIISEDSLAPGSQLVIRRTDQRNVRHCRR